MHGQKNIKSKVSICSFLYIVVALYSLLFLLTKCLPNNCEKHYYFRYVCPSVREHRTQGLLPDRVCLWDSY